MADLYDRLLEGDESAVPQFKAFLRKHPALMEDFAGKATEVLLARIALTADKCMTGSPLIYKEALTVKLEAMRAELSPTSPIERLLVERILCCWLWVYDADLQCVLRGNTTIELAKYDIHRQDRAQRRYLSAIKTLATMRRLALPLQIDLNLAGMVETKNTAAAIPLDRFQSQAKN